MEILRRDVCFVRTDEYRVVFVVPGRLSTRWFCLSFLLCVFIKDHTQYIAADSKDFISIISIAHLVFVTAGLFALFG